MYFIVSMDAFTWILLKGDQQQEVVKDRRMTEVHFGFEGCCG